MNRRRKQSAHVAGHAARRRKFVATIKDATILQASVMDADDIIANKELERDSFMLDFDSAEFDELFLNEGNDWIEPTNYEMYPHQNYLKQLKF